ncbi:MAG: c-type cytochrome [Thiobacillaceae bacterium]
MRYGWCVVGLAVALAATAGEGPRPDAQPLVRFVRQECGFCHGLRLNGGLGVPLTAETMRTRPIDYLETVISQGIPGTAMPGWAPYLTASQVRWIAERLREGFPE